MNITKQLLIDITFSMLYKRGYCATSLMDILKEAKVTKGALYYHFVNKNELILGAMQHYLELILDSHWTTPLKNSDMPIDTLIEQIEMLYKLYESDDSFLMVKHGCPLNNFINDMSNKEDKFYIYLKSIYYRWQESLQQSLMKAQKFKQTNTIFNSKTEALFIISSIEGSITSAKVYNDLATLKASFNSLIKYIRTL